MANSSWTTRNAVHLWNGWQRKQKLTFLHERTWIHMLFNKNKCTVWCALWAGETISLCFLRTKLGNTVTVNGVRHQNFKPTFLVMLSFRVVTPIGHRGLGVSCGGHLADIFFRYSMFYLEKFNLGHPIFDPHYTMTKR